MEPVLTRRPGNGKRRTLALLGGFCLFLSLVEYLIPKPLPFMRIGLANLPLLLALDIFTPADFFLLAALKTFGQGIISGTLFSWVFLFSLAGTFSSAGVMFVMRHLFKKNRVGFAGTGCAGAMVSNGVQLLLARYFVFGAGVRYLAPPFLAAGFASGIALGLFCEFFRRNSRWYAAHAGMDAPKAPLPDRESPPPVNSEFKKKLEVGKTETRRLLRRKRWNDLFGAQELFIAGFIMALLFLFNPSPFFRIPQFLFFCLLAWFSGKKNNFLLTVSIIMGIIFFNVLVPYGKVIAVVGILRITQGSLLAGIGKAVTLEGLVMLSSACIKSDLRLPGSIGLLLGESLRLLEFLRERKTAVRRRAFIAGLDRLLLEAEAFADSENKAKKSAALAKPARRSALPLLVMVIITAAGILPAAILN